jgi:hypothetical protein
MTKRIPRNFLKTPEGAIASYDYVDLDEGTGIVKLYGSNVVDNGTTSYVLSRNVTHSNDVFTFYTTGSSGPDAKRLDLDFDLTFNLPKIIRGKFLAEISWIAGHTTSANKGGTSYAIVKIRKWDGAVETEIASNTKSDTMTVVSLDSWGVTRQIEIDLASKTHFRKGETLRITVEMWSTANSSGTQLALMHDPKDRQPSAPHNSYTGGVDYDPPTTQLVFHVPFDIDL